GKIKSNSKNETPVSNIDFYPTLLEATGTVKPNSKILDGQSLLPLFFGNKSFDTERPLFWHFPIYLESSYHQFKDGRGLFFRTRPGSVVRLGKWKLHEYFEDGDIELYNLEVDQGEHNNLAENHPDVVKKLYQTMIKLRMETNAPVPKELNPFYDKSFINR
ncbi:MAG: aryl-sulfate sulfohydrolase, partial [Bacteroidetes bacterium]